MDRKRFVIQTGFGVDLHGEDNTKAAVKAVKNAISSTCLCGLTEIFGRTNAEGVHIDVLLAAPAPASIDTAKVQAQFPIGTVSITVQQGGLTASGLHAPQFAEGKHSLIGVNAAVTVYIEDAPAGTTPCSN